MAEKETVMHLLVGGKSREEHSRQRDQQCTGCLREGGLTDLRCNPEGARAGSRKAL